MHSVIPGSIRPQSVYISGNPGSGKSSLIQHMALRDIRAGHGVCVIDPTGDLVNTLVHWIPRHRASDTIFFDTDHPTPIEFFSYRNPEERQVLADQLLNLFALESAPISRPRLQRIIGTLFDANENGGDCTFLDIQHFIENENRREAILERAPHRREQWTPFPKPSETVSIIERLTPFTESPALRLMFGATHGLNISDVMQANKILLVNLKDIPTDLFIGSLITAKIQQATFGRRYIPESERIPYYLYIDECQTIMKYAAPEFESILTRARKYKLCLTLANQIPEDLPKEIKQKLGTIATLVLFNLDDENSRIFRSRIAPRQTLRLLPKFNAVVSSEGRVELVRTPTFLGTSPASYAEAIKKRAGDNAPLLSRQVLQDEVNGQEHKSEEIAPSGSATIPMDDSKT